VREAKVICLCPQYYLKDLSKSIRKDEFFWLPEGQANSSKDLKHAQRIGAVKVLWENRCRQLREPMTKQPPPPFVANYRPPPAHIPPVVETPLAQEGVNLDHIREVFAEEFSKFRVDLMKELSHLITKIQAPSQGLDEVALQKIIMSLQQIPHNPISTPPSQGYSTKDVIFIPSDLVPKGDNKDFKVESVEEEGNLDDALAALKNIKKTKKK